MNSQVKGGNLQGRGLGSVEALNFVKALEQTWWVAGKMLVGG